MHTTIVKGLTRLGIVMAASGVFFVGAQVVAGNTNGLTGDGSLLTGPEAPVPHPLTLFVIERDTNVIYLKPTEVVEQWQCTAGCITPYVRDLNGCVDHNMNVWDKGHAVCPAPPDGTGHKIGPILPVPPKGYKPFQGDTEKNVRWERPMGYKDRVNYDDCWIGATTTKPAMICDRWNVGHQFDKWEVWQPSLADLPNGSKEF